MSDHHEEDDFEPTFTTGYKPGEKKTLEEYHTLDSADESLNKWKQSLGLNSTANGSKDPRKVIVEKIVLESPGRPDIDVDLSNLDNKEPKKQKQQFIIKEGAEYRLKVTFKVQHDVVSGLRYMQVVKRKGIRVDKSEEMIGSYSPSDGTYEKKFQMEEAPSGMIARGSYEAKSKFIDDDGVTHMDWEWSIQVKKDW